MQAQDQRYICGCVQPRVFVAFFRVVRVAVFSRYTARVNSSLLEYADHVISTSISASFTQHHCTIFGSSPNWLHANLTHCPTHSIITNIIFYSVSLDVGQKLAHYQTDQIRNGNQRVNCGSGYLLMFPASDPGNFDSTSFYSVIYSCPLKLGSSPTTRVIYRALFHRRIIELRCVSAMYNVTPHLLSAPSP